MDAGRDNHRRAEFGRKLLGERPGKGLFTVGRDRENRAGYAGPPRISSRRMGSSQNHATDMRSVSAGNRDTEVPPGTAGDGLEAESTADRSHPDGS